MHDGADDRIDLLAKAGITSALPEGFTPRCPSCRYDLSGLPEMGRASRCPECGARFSMDLLIIEWRSALNAPPSDVDFYLAAILCFFVFIPADLRDAASLFWKSVFLGALWLTVYIWFRRRAGALQEPDDAHRLLWLWAPCLATATGLSYTPLLGRITALLMLALAAVIAFKAVRRAPVRSSIIIAITLLVPLAATTLVGLAALMAGLAGRTQGHFWSQADFPSWYWQNAPGRIRGMSSPQALRIGATLLSISAAGIAIILALGIHLLRRRRRGRA